jgi:hypothetical protein
VSDPKPWLDSDLAPESVVQLLRAAQLPRPMRPSEFKRAHRRVVGIAGVSAGAAALVWIKSVAMAGLLGVAGGAVAVGAITVLRSQSPSPPAATTALSATAAPGRPLPTSSNALPVPEAPAPAVSASASSGSTQGAPSSTPAETMAEEAALLEQARVAMSSDPSQALSILQTHASRFPRARLSMEREFMTVDALQRLGRVDEARARANAMIASAPDSLYARRLRAMLQIQPATADSE